MEAIQILVEGETDCNFLKALLAHMPNLPFSSSPASSTTWQKDASEKVPFQYTHLTDDLILILTTVKGWEKIRSYKMVLENRTLDGVPVNIQASAFLFDADAPTTSFGDPCNFGGHAARLAKLRELCVTASVQPDIFLFPDNQHDGTLETLLLDLIPEDYRRELIDGCWGAYCDCVTLANTPPASRNGPPPKINSTTPPSRMSPCGIGTLLPLTLSNVSLLPFLSLTRRVNAISTPVKRRLKSISHERGYLADLFVRLCATLCVPL